MNMVNNILALHQHTTTVIVQVNRATIVYALTLVKLKTKNIRHIKPTQDNIRHSNFNTLVCVQTRCFIGKLRDTNSSGR